MAMRRSLSSQPMGCATRVSAAGRVAWLLGTAAASFTAHRTQLSFSIPKAPAPKNTDESQDVPGDDYGIYETRTTFTRPVPRNVKLDGTAEELFDATTPPEQCASPGLMACLSRRLGITEEQAAAAIIDGNHNLNAALRIIEEAGWAKLPPHSYGLVAVEYYEPEAYCLASFAVPTYEQLTDPDVLEALHELTLSAAEMPMDSSSEELVRRFASEWTTEQGDKCSEVMARVPHGGLQLKGLALLPLGEFSANGHFVKDPASRDYPNIGTAAAACCMDLTTGINNRFRFEVERISDSVSEHVVREHLSFGQQVHLLKQPYFWSPDFSVEDFLRYKESLLQPAAIINQLRYAFCGHHMDDQARYALPESAGPTPRDKALRHRPNPYRNLVEMEELKTKQHELGKHYKENATPSQCFTRTGTPIIMASTAGELSGFAGDSKYEKFDDITTMERKVFGAVGHTSATERLWKKFYTDNLF